MFVSNCFTTKYPFVKSAIQPICTPISQKIDTLSCWLNDCLSLLKDPIRPLCKTIDQHPTRWKIGHVLTVAAGATTTCLTSNWKFFGAAAGTSLALHIVKNVAPLNDQDRQDIRQRALQIPLFVELDSKSSSELAKSLDFVFLHSYLGGPSKSQAWTGLAFFLASMEREKESRLLYSKVFEGLLPPIEAKKLFTKLHQEIVDRAHSLLSQGESLGLRKHLPSIKQFQARYLQKENSIATRASLYYLRHPENAPQNWLSQKVIVQHDSDSYLFEEEKLSLLGATNIIPFIVLQQWDCDPFLKLIDLGANVNEVTEDGFSPLRLVCIHGINVAGQKEETIYIQRAKKLIEAGASITEKFTNFSLSWLRTNCTDELKARAVKSEGGIERAQVKTMLPKNWALPDWVPPFVPLDAKVSAPSTRPPSKNLCSRLILHPLRDVLRPLAVKVGEQWYRMNNWQKKLANLTGIHFFRRAVLLNGADLQRLHAKALTNPLYAQLWEKTSKPTLKSAPTKHRSSCNTFKNTLYINRGYSEEEALGALVFESANMYQSKRFAALFNLLFQGSVEQEEYVRIMERIEYDSLLLKKKICDYGTQHLGWLKFDTMSSNFLEVWEMHNLWIYPENQLISHSDRYRMDWKRFSFLYYLRHPEKTPENFDFNAEIINDLPPIVFLAVSPYQDKLPQMTRIKDQDPFMLLIDRKVDVNNGSPLGIIAALGTLPECKEEHKPIHIARAKRLLQAGATIPKDLPKEALDWLHNYCAEEIAFSQRSATK